MKDEAKYWKEQYEDLKLAADLSMDQITIADGNGIFKKVNIACESYFGVEEKEIIGKSCFDMEEKGVFNISATAEVIRKKQKVRFIQKTRADKSLLVTGYPVFNKDEELVRIINLSTDVTEKGDLERAFIDAKTKLEWFENEKRYKILDENCEISSTSKNMDEIKKVLKYFTNKNILILLLGETGVGKSHVANYIHDISNRSEEPFITINCGAIPKNLLESELFGYEEGSFTGALKSGKQGLFEIANNGTIFLDEIGELSLELQVKLLYVLEERRYRRIGGKEDLELNARILVATNRDLMECVKKGEFRKDLYYRINVFPIKIPELYNRKEDIPELINKFLNRYNKKYDYNKEISPRAYEELLLYRYPGNIRELKNIIERLVIISEENIIELNDVKKIVNFENQLKDENIRIVPLKQGIENYEKKLLESVVKKYKTTRDQAEVLEVDQSTIVRKRKKYSL